MATLQARSPEELTEKLELYQSTRDRRLRDELITAYSGFAGALASRFDTGRDSSDDLRQVALVGLVNAVDRFDPTRGVQFTTFAWATISGELKRHLRDRTWRLRVPRRLQEQTQELAQATDDLAQELGRPPTVPELAARTGLTYGEIVDARAARSADRMVGIDGGPDEGPALQFGTDESGYDRVEKRQAVARLVASLSERERQVLHLRFSNDMTQSEIGAAIGLSQMQVSRLLEQILSRLRTTADADALCASGSSASAGR